MPGATDYEAAVAALSPRAYFKMQEASGLPQDSSGNALHMDATAGTPVYELPGPFTGSKSIQLPASANFSRTTQVSVKQNDWTIEAWVYVMTITASGRSLVQNDTTGAAGWGIGYDFGFRTNGARDSVNLPPFDKACPLFTWKHVVLARDSSWHYYLDGRPDVGDTSAAGTPGVPAGAFRIGAGSGLSGRFSYAIVYESCLTAAQVLANYRAALQEDLRATYLGTRRSLIKATA